MVYVRNKTLKELNEELIGQFVTFKSTCEFFPNFNITGTVLEINIGKNNEYLFKLKTLYTNRIVDVGSNMANLSYEIVKDDK